MFVSYTFIYLLPKYYKYYIYLLKVYILLVNLIDDTIYGDQRYRINKNT